MRTRTFIAASAAALALTGGVVAAAHADGGGVGGGRAGTAQAESGALAKGTPNGTEYSFQGYGTVTWIDHETSGTREDRDDFYVDDSNGDGYSFRLTVYKGGKTYTKHVYDGAAKTLNVGNVKKGKKVYFKVCGYNNGHKVDCSAKKWWRE
ncbi:hypothetical protein [Streptomyces inhibens]|uniref:hypothetical protein n=1 Tax=Streptomyces inhibens TaxID=2293571 RepID=UPI001EE6B7BD|nr:hypothetical protein [Streptomyces inhibens]UKY54771.1 hypothetical protein KI385_42295 [Streptomyces inhibens]